MRKLIPLEYLGPGLRELRELRRMQQNELASRAGITRAMLSAYETGKRLPSVRTLWRILQAAESDPVRLYQAMERVENRRRFPEED